MDDDDDVGEGSGKGLEGFFNGTRICLFVFTIPGVEVTVVEVNVGFTHETDGFIFP